MADPPARPSVHTKYAAPFGSAARPRYSPRECAPAGVSWSELGPKQKRQAAFHWANNGAYWMRNQLLLARLHRKAGREADARRIEAEFSKLLVVADPGHQILLERRRLQES
jgi:hypothetical protein